MEEVVEAYIALYGMDGFDKILEFRYNIDPRTLIINAVEKSVPKPTVTHFPSPIKRYLKK